MLGDTDYTFREQAPRTPEALPIKAKEQKQQLASARERALKDVADQLPPEPSERSPTTLREIRVLKEYLNTYTEAVLEKISSAAGELTEGVHSYEELHTAALVEMLNLASAEDNLRAKSATPEKKVLKKKGQEYAPKEVQFYQGVKRRETFRAGIEPKIRVDKLHDAPRPESTEWYKPGPISKAAKSPSWESPDTLSPQEVREKLVEIKEKALKKLQDELRPVTEAALASSMWTFVPTKEKTPQEGQKRFTLDELKSIYRDLYRSEFRGSETALMDAIEEKLSDVDISRKNDGTFAVAYSTEISRRKIDAFVVETFPKDQLSRLADLYVKAVYELEIRGIEQTSTSLAEMMWELSHTQEIATLDQLKNVYERLFDKTPKAGAQDLIEQLQKKMAATIQAQDDGKFLVVRSPFFTYENILKHIAKTEIDAQNSLERLGHEARSNLEKAGVELTANALYTEMKKLAQPDLPYYLTDNQVRAYVQETVKTIRELLETEVHDARVALEAKGIDPTVAELVQALEYPNKAEAEIFIQVQQQDLTLALELLEVQARHELRDTNYSSKTLVDKMAYLCVGQDEQVSLTRRQIELHVASSQKEIDKLLFDLQNEVLRLSPNLQPTELANEIWKRLSTEESKTYEELLELYDTEFPQMFEPPSQNERENHAFLASQLESKIVGSHFVSNDDGTFTLQLTQHKGISYDLILRAVTHKA